MLCVLTTHPIQYQVPIWRAIAERARMPLRVMYMSDQGSRPMNDRGFGRDVAWDIDVLGGYNSEVVNVRRRSHPDSFWSYSMKGDFSARLRQLGAKVLWVQGWQVAAYWQAIIAARSLGVQVWMRGETNERSNSTGAVGAVRRVLLRQLLNRVDRLLCIGEANRRFYISLGARNEKLIAAPYCVDNARFRQQAAAARIRRAELRRRWLIPEDAFCPVFVGKFLPKKRPLDLVRAAGLLRQFLGDRPLHLLWVGSGELGGDLRRATSVRFDAEGQVVAATDDARVESSFVGFLNQTEISQAYAAADCLVLPSDAKETWGLVVNEAMACGLPCVTSDACGCADDLIEPMRPDLCYPVGDVAGLARALGCVLTNPPTPVTLEKEIDAYDYLRTVEAVEALYEEAQSRIANSEPALALT